MLLRKYQEDGVLQLSKKLASGKRKVILQCATGGGKTIMFSAIANRYIQKSGKSVLILVHRKELLQQTRRTLYNAFQISSQIIIAGMHHIPPAAVYVGMVESVNKRIDQLQNIGMVIIDEAHLNIHYKMHDHFPTQFIIGFTATPLSANKRKPLNLYYEDIVCCVDIPDLIREGALCQNVTWAPRDTVERATLTVKNGEYDEGLMALSFSKPKYVNNTVTA
jgi:superfamily II DNA or RNA helicase